MSLIQLILLISNIPALIVAIYAAKQYIKFDKELRIFSGFLVFNFIIQSSSSILSLWSINNMPFLHLYTAGTGFLVISFYHLILRQYVSSSILLWIAFGFSHYSIIDSLFIEDIFTFNTISITVLSVIIIILSLSTFNLFLIDSVKEQHRSRIRGLNWINSGFFIYFSTNVILYYYGNELMSSLFPDEIGSLAWLPHVFFMIIMHTCFFVGLWKSPKR